MYWGIPCLELKTNSFNGFEIGIFDEKYYLIKWGSEWTAEARLAISFRYFSKNMYWLWHPLKILEEIAEKYELTVN